jgi:hypothetical protein
MTTTAFPTSELAKIRLALRILVSAGNESDLVHSSTAPSERRIDAVNETGFNLDA